MLVVQFRRARRLADDAICSWDGLGAGRHLCGHPACELQDLGPGPHGVWPVRLKHGPPALHHEVMVPRACQRWIMTVHSDGPGREERNDPVSWVPPSLRRRRPGQRRQTPRAFLATTGCFVADAEIQRHGALARILAEDVAWRFSLEDWHGRRPPWWAFRRLRQWREEYVILAAERNRIARRARFYGVSD